MKASKLTARGLAYVLRAIGRKIAKHHRAKQTPHGKQSVKKLMAHGASASSIELSGDNLSKKAPLSDGINPVADAKIVSF